MTCLGLRSIGFFCSILLVNMPFCILTTGNTVNINDKTIALAQLTSPIMIEDDNDFDSYGFPGSGTAEDPYLLSNLWIEGENGITISNVDSHFVITDCIFWTHTGASIENARSFTIQNTEFRRHDGAEAVWIYYCNDFLIRNITIYPDSIDYFSFNIGIYVLDSSNGIIDNSSIINCTSGVGVKGSFNITITGNSIIGQKTGWAEGVSATISQSVISRNCITRTSPCIVLSSSNDNIISENDCFEGGLGIVVQESQRNEITSNLCRQNIYSGFYISFGSSFNIIRENRLENNKEYGVKFVSRMNSIPISNQVFRNVFISNNQGGQQAYDDHGMNGFGYNYWSDWTYQNDEDNDGFYDEPYPIAGSSIFDHYPLVNESLVYSLSIDSIPVPISPREIVIIITGFSLFAVLVIHKLSQFIDSRRNRKRMEGGATSASPFI